MCSSNVTSGVEWAPGDQFRKRKQFVVSEFPDQCNVEPNVLS